MVRGAIAGLLLTASSLGCGAMDCSDIGCTASLRVELRGEPADSFTMTARMPGGEPREPLGVGCSPGGSCVVLFDGFTEPTVILTYESSTERVERALSPDYDVSYPNGRSCGPTCFNATFVFRLDD